MFRGSDGIGVLYRTDVEYLEGGTPMRKLLAGLALGALLAATAGMAQDAKPRAYTMVVSGAR